MLDCVGVWKPVADLVQAKILSKTQLHILVNVPVSRLDPVIQLTGRLPSIELHPCFYVDR
jgi:hypothetical protein